MPVFLKAIKNDLEKDRGKVGKDKNGEYKFVPPSIVGRKINQYTDLRTTKRTIRHSPGIKSLTKSAIVKSEKTSKLSPPSYKVSIQFFNVEYKDLETKLFNQKATIKNSSNRNVNKYYKVLSARRNPVKVKCQCPDFRHRFETPLADQQGLIGGPRKYTRKTPSWPVGRPSVNSTEKLGFCKHINSLLNDMRDKGELKN